MSRESEPHHEFLIPLATLGILAVSFFAFSKRVKAEIKKRDGYKSVLSGKTINLEVAHINHNKKNPRYNKAENGRTLSIAEHFWDHVNRHGTEGLGLTNRQNDWAIWQLWKRFWGIK